MPYNKVAQFVLGLVLILVAWKAYSAGWFSAFTFEQVNGSNPSYGLGSPYGLIPFAIDAVCLVGLSGFALIGLIRGAIGPLFGGIPEWVAKTMAEFRGEQAAVEAAVSGVRTSTGRELTVAEVNKYLLDRIKKLEAKTAELPEPTPPEPPKTPEELLAENAVVMAAMQARLDALDAPVKRPVTRNARAK